MGQHGEKTYEFTAARVVYLMNLTIETISPSSVSSHVKGELLFLLEKLKREESLRLLEAEASRSNRDA